MKPRLLIDLQGCQTRNSYNRGIGRYSTSLTRSLLEINRQRGDVFDIVGLLNGSYPEASVETQQALSSAPGLLTFREYPTGESLAGSIAEQSRIRGLAAASNAYNLKPDIIHVSSLIEGYENGAAFSTFPKNLLPGAIRTVTVYDLIPHLFPKSYLSDRPYEEWYRSAVDTYSTFDLLFAISEATRSDIIQHLNIDPDKVINISAAVDGQFCKLDDAEIYREEIARKLGILRPFILYTGGADHRKNLFGAIEAFALLPERYRSGLQLAIVCRMDKQTESSLVLHAQKLGLRPDEVVLTGYVSDRDLVLLYNLTTLFIFPSTYEGFGLPVLEAMSCGAAVLVGDNSSLPEVVGRDDLLFDASNPQSIADRIAVMLSSEDRLAEFRHYSLKRAAEFSWSRSAERVYETFARCLVERQDRERLFRPLVAMTTPLPPAKSGISDYSADLLGELTKKMDLELFLSEHSMSLEASSGCPVKPIVDLSREWRSFDTVLYQMGNSTFHTEMLSLLPETGGILVMHDVYLSNLKAWLDQHEGRSGFFERELEIAHGADGPGTLHSMGFGEAINQWPASKAEIAAADAVIVHSDFAKEVIGRFYPSLVDKVSIIRQPRRIPQAYGPAAQADARRALGLDEAAFVVVSVGVVGPSKKLDTVVEGFELFARHRAGAQLILAGDYAEDSWSIQLRSRVQQTEGRVTLTGHLPFDQFDAYCQACDVAVQLRASTRGETSAAVLQLMGSGKQVIVNNFADFTYYPDNVVVKVSEQPGAEEIAAALERVAGQSDEVRQRADERARTFVETNHSHEAAAQAYEALIRRTKRYGSDRKIIDALVQQLADLKGASLSSLRTSDIEQVFSPALQERINVERRLLIDVSHTYHTKLKTGIQRVVRELTREGYHAFAKDGLNVQAFIREKDGRFRTADTFSLELEGVKVSEEIDTDLTIRPNDQVLMLDSSWFEYDHFIPLFQAVRKLGGSVHTCVYDLVPILHPELTGEELPVAFRQWLARAAIESDSLLCISKAVADETVHYLAQNGIPRRSGLQINWFHLGSNLPTSGSEGQDVRDAFSGGPSVMMVGTVEIRKRHAFALDVMERLWEKGHTCRLVLLGKKGWHVDDLDSRLRHHREFGKRIRWVEQPTDADLAYGYAHAHALLFPSLYEGYGLPVAEALRSKLPVIATNIPVLREVGGDAALYAEMNDVEQWCRHIAFLTEGDRKTVDGGHFLSWEESYEQMKFALRGDVPYRTMPILPDSRSA